MQRKKIKIGSILLHDAHQVLIVDKSKLIKDFLDSDKKINILLRPSGFGKSFNLQLLHHFFAKTVSRQKTKNLFDMFSISQSKEIMQNQGNFTVIFISFYSMIGLDEDPIYKDVYGKIKNIFSELYDIYSDVLLNSDQLSEEEKIDYNAILDCSADENLIKKAIYLLTAYLYKQYKTKVIVLMDEFDVVSCHYSNPTTNQIACNQFMTDVLTHTFKDNPFIEKALLTGIMNTCFPLCNEIKVFSPFDTSFSDSCGFTNQDLQYLLNESNIKVDNNMIDEIQKNYGGYQFGQLQIINPTNATKHIVKLLSSTVHNNKYIYYWSDNGEKIYNTMSKLFLLLDDKLKPSIISLCTNGSITVDINFLKNEFSYLSIEKINKCQDSFLVYLTLVGCLSVSPANADKCTFYIPNNELQKAFQQLAYQIDYLSHITVKMYSNKQTVNNISVNSMTSIPSILFNVKNSALEVETKEKQLTNNKGMYLK